MTTIQKIGITIFIASFLSFILSLGMSKYTLTNDVIDKAIDNSYHKVAVKHTTINIIGKEYNSNVAFLSELKKSLQEAKQMQDDAFKNGLAAKVEEWKFKLSDYDLKNLALQLVLYSQTGFLVSNNILFLILIFGGGILGALLYIIPKSKLIPGIKNNNIFRSPMHSRGWLGIITGSFLIAFYIVLYWYPEYLSSWIKMVDPISKSLSGKAASQWFLYGVLYTICMMVMGVRMIIKYRHSKYQILRTGSVIFFQTCFAFLIPEILVRLNKPYFDFKNMWPLKYDFFFEWNINTLTNSGHIGMFMLVWGIALFVIGVPVITYFFGKRWYCSWVCGCGGLAETLGDPFRQLSNKKLKAWKIERWLIYSVLVFAVLMTLLVLYTFFTGNSNILFLNSYDVRKWYGFLIGSVFSGVVGTGFYPFMGGRVWCRFGCPLAAYLGIVQKFKSKFRITVNGGQCISCGNCSTYCEMGIDVRWYAQRGQDIVRSSCVGCGICSAVCPRGVLKLENASFDIKSRAKELRTDYIKIEEVGILNKL